MQIEELIAYIFEGKPHTPPFETWLNHSKRFKTFAENYRDKIRKKVRNVENGDGMKDIYFELEMAYLLLGESQFLLEYEKYSASKQRGPDFTVTFKTHTPFNVEARRVRGLDTLANDREAIAGRLIDAVCDKVRQMPPSIVNVLALTSAVAVSEAELVQAMVMLRTQAESKNEPFFTRRRFKNSTEFIRQYHHLSGVLYWWENAVVLWKNPLAKHTVPREVANILGRLAHKT